MDIQVKPFSEEQMDSLLDEFLKEEYETERRRKSLLTEGNLIFMTEEENEYINEYVEGIGNFGYWGEGYPIKKEVGVRCFFNILPLQLKINPEILRSQIIIRIIKKNIHFSVVPGSQFSVVLEENKDKISCSLSFTFTKEGGYYPRYTFFLSQMKNIQDIVLDSLNNPNLPLNDADIIGFIDYGYERGFNYCENINNHEWYNEYSDDDYDGFEDDEQMRELNKKINLFYDFADVERNRDY